MRLVRLILICLGVSQAILWGSAHAASPPEPTDLVDRAETILWGHTMQADFDMAIATTSWSRTLNLKVWMDRPGKSFLRVTGPVKDAGILSLRIGSEMWNYIPAIERTIKIPPSLMLQPWLGSDFTNDDLVKESSIVNDYTHKLLQEIELDGFQAYEIEALPKSGAPVVWGKIHYAIRKDGVPLRLKFFDSRDKLVRTLSYSNIKEMGGHQIPTKWEMVPADKPGKSTTIYIKSAVYDAPIDGAIFSMRNLHPKD